MRRTASTDTHFSTRTGPDDGRRASARATLIMLDGARPDVFQHLTAAGDLPNVTRHLSQGGLTRASTVFPSTTGVAYLPFLTGCYPGTCNVPGIRWLDPARYGGRWWRDRAHVRSYCGLQGGLLGSDLRRGIASVFDLEPDSVGLCTPFARGLAREHVRASLRRALWGGLAHYTAGYGVLDRAVGRGFLQAARERHRFVFAVFPGIDGLSHFLDPWHPAVLDLYRAFDRIFGDYAAASGLDGDHLTLIVSDHGLSRVDRHTDVALALEARGIPTLRHPILWRRSPLAAVMVSGNASAQVYLRPGERRGWAYDLPEIEAGTVGAIPSDLPQYLAELPGVGLVVGSDGPDAVVLSRSGRARLTDGDAGSIAYRPETGDPLALGPLAVRHEREWLAVSFDGPYPDAPTQLLQLLRSRRSGDLTVIAGPGTDLRARWEIPAHRSGHGSLHADHMRCLAAANRRWTGPIRTVDLFPVILEHLGLEVPRGIDGVAPVATIEECVA